MKDKPERRATQSKVWWGANLTPEQRSTRVKKAWAKLTPEQHQARAKKAANGRREWWAKLKPEERSSYNDARRAKTPEQRKARGKNISVAQKAHWAKVPRAERKTRLKNATQGAKTRLASLTPEERIAIAGKAAEARWAKLTTTEERARSGKKGWLNLTPEQHEARAKKAADGLRKKWAILKAIENRAAATPLPGGVKRKPGPNPDIDTATRVLEIVKKITGDSRRWRGKLDDICEALDSAKLPCPSTWLSKQGLSTWCRAAISQPALAIRAIEARLNNAQKS